MEGRVQIEACPPPDVCRLVRVDFTDPPPLGRPLWFRVATAWVYPSPDNWGLRRRRLFVDKIRIFDNDDGSWRLWLNVNNASAPGPGTDATLPPGEVLFPTTQEWTKIVHTVYPDFVSEGELALGFETGKSGAQGLGPDLLLFSKDLVVDQLVSMQATGFNEEGIFSDETLGLISRKFIAESGHDYEDFEDNHGSSGGHYRLFFRLQDLGPVMPASLSTGAIRLLSAYDLTRVCRPGSVCLEELRPPDRPLTWHPDEEPLPPRVPSLPRAETALYAPQAFEAYHLENLEPRELFESIVEAQANDPERLARLLQETREAIDEDLDAIGPEVLLDVWALRAALPLDLWREYFGDLPLPESEPGASTRRMDGIANVREGGNHAIVRVDLHCDPARVANQLRVDWGQRRGERNRFRMDLMTAFGCDLPPEPMRVHRGAGIGRLNEQPGARAEWIFEDAGRRRADRVRLVVWDPYGRKVLDLATTIAAGNLRGVEGDRARGARSVP
jgi:hypothetical protein